MFREPKTVMRGMEVAIVARGFGWAELELVVMGEMC